METGTGFNFARNPRDFEGYYFCTPEEIAPLLHRAGFGGVRLLGTEGPFGGRMERFHALKSRRVRQAWMDFVLEYAEQPSLVHASEHLLAIARPRRNS